MHATARHVRSAAVSLPSGAVSLLRTTKGRSDGDPRAPPPPPASKPGRLPPYPYHKTNLQPASIYDKAASITTSLYQQIGCSRRAAERRARLLAAAAKLDQA